MKKIYLTVLAIVTALLCTFGFLHHTGYLGKIVRSGSNAGKKSSAELSDRQAVSAFSSVEVDAAVIDLAISYGTTAGEYTVSYQADNTKMIPTVTVDNGCLKITQENKNSLLKSWNQSDNRLTVQVTIPVLTGLDSIEVEAGVGDITLDSLTAKSLEFKTGVGDITLKSLSLQTLDLDTGVGDISLNGCDIGHFSAEAGVGNVQLYANSINDMDIDTGTGSVKITGTGDLSQYTMDIDVGIGSLFINGSIVNPLDRKYSQKGTGSGKIIIDSGIGSVEITE